MKKIAIYGMGAIGGLLAARLAQAGHQVSAVARGQTLSALLEHGVRTREPGTGQVRAHALKASAEPAELGVQDIVIIAVKATGLQELAAKIAPLIGPQTILLPAMNGVPWWFLRAADGALQGQSLRSLDADGSIARALPLAQILGCVVHLSASCPEAGMVEVAMGNRLILGEPGGGNSARNTELVQILREAGFEVEDSENIRRDIWYKLWGNMTMNPISALTGATGDKILADPLVRKLCLDVMVEAAAIGARIGCPITQSGEDRMVITGKLGAFRTSMLQDAESGKPLELDALLGAVQEIGGLLEIPTPNIDALFGLTRLFARCHCLYPA